MASSDLDITFSTLLERTVTEPGIVSRAYTAFHGYSIGNQLLARALPRAYSALKRAPRRDSRGA